MAFIERADLHQQPHTARHHANFVCLYKKVLNQGYSNSPQNYRLFHHCHQNSCHEEISLSLKIDNNQTVQYLENRQAIKPAFRIAV